MRPFWQKYSKSWLHDGWHTAGIRQWRKRRSGCLLSNTKLSTSHKYHDLQDQLEGWTGEEDLLDTKYKKLKLIYKSLIRPTLKYCSSIWYPIFITDATEIEKVQRRSTKLVPELKNLSYTDRLKHLDLTTLAYRHKRTDLIRTFKIMNKIDNITLDSFFTRNDNLTKGHKWKLDKPRAITSIRQICFSHRVINWWNDLPKNVADCISINSFKNLLENALKNDPIKYEFK